MKLREVSVGYTLTGGFVSRALGLSSLDLRVAGRNLAVWTPYTGADPETNLSGRRYRRPGNRLVQQPPDAVVRVLRHPEPLMPTRSLEVYAMRNHFATALLGLGAGLGITGCGDFLTGPKLSDNPNRPVAATNANLLVASQTNLAIFPRRPPRPHHLRLDAAVRRHPAAVQQPRPLHRRRRRLLHSPGTSLRQRRPGRPPAAAASGTRHRRLRLCRRGQGARGLVVGTAADVWGDVPYSQAADSTVATPALDPQQQVYAELQATLDAAIASMNASNPVVTRPAWRIWSMVGIWRNGRL